MVGMLKRRRLSGMGGNIYGWFPMDLSRRMWIYGWVASVDWLGLGDVIRSPYDRSSWKIIRSVRIWSSIYVLDNISRKGFVDPICYKNSDVGTIESSFFKVGINLRAKSRLLTSLLIFRHPVRSRPTDLGPSVRLKRSSHKFSSAPSMYFPLFSYHYDFLSTATSQSHKLTQFSSLDPFVHGKWLAKPVR